ncbi:MAG: RHS repeat-associated core domain-containing protein [Xanthomonadales bacterium]|nr:RHS repeat-associated core domain-containing protein [Xanthomonadales bacterium]
MQSARFLLTSSPIVSAVLRVLVAAGVVLLCPRVARADDEGPGPRAVGGLTILENYNQAIRSLSTIDMLGTDMFGDQTNLANGGTTFTAVDASLPTNSGLRVAVGRKLALNSLSLDEHGGTTAAGAQVFGPYWELDVPYIRGVFDARFGWISPNNLPRCSAGHPSGFAPPGSNGVGAWSGIYFEPEKFWSGNWINIPGHGEEELLSLPFDRIRPSDGVTYLGRTVSEWRIACEPTLQNGAGEGFVAVLPDGTRYRFDWIVTRSTSSLMGYDGSGGGASSLMIPRSEIFLYATEVRDRFGNTVTYSWSGDRLTSITSSDGASISLEYDTDGKVRYIDAGSRRWEYRYTGSGIYKTLSSLILPDQSLWTYVYDNLYGGVRADARQMWQSCTPTVGTMRSDVAPSAGETSSITITHPAGATGTFRFRKIIHGTNDTPSFCELVPLGPGFVPDLYVRITGVPMAYQIASLHEKTITGHGLDTQTWSYRYVPSWSWGASYGGCPPTGCGLSSQTWVDDPDGTRHSYVFGNDYRRNPGKLLSVNVAKPVTASLRTTTNTYQQNGDGQPYPACPSVTSEPEPDPFARGANERSSSNGWMYCPRPLKTSTVAQQGELFSRTNTSFDLFARPTGIERESSLGDFKNEAVAYHDHLPTWTLGQLASVSVNGLVAVTNAYYQATGALHTESRFGKLERTLEWNGDGTLKEVKDGLDQKTSFASHKRGIPQSITYANSDSESVVVDDLGQITEHANAAGSTTWYRYDAMGRVNRIIHPTGDPVAWNDTFRTFEPVETAEYGLPAGHWRLTESTGDARSITYYDARWRPVLTRIYDNADESTTRRMVLRRYDAENRVTFASYPQRSIASVSSTPAGVLSEYDGLGRLTKTLADSELTAGALETRIEYPGDSFVRRTIDPRNHVTTIEFQAFDDPDSAQPRTITGELGIVTTIGRDVFGKPETMARTGAWDGAPLSVTRSYAYDTHQRLCRTVEPESGATVYAYDAANNIDWAASGLPANTACPVQGSSPHALALNHTYDPRNRLVGTSYTRDGTTATIGRTWTPDGLVETVSADGTMWTYVYNRRRLLTSETLNGAPGTYVIGRDYDSNGHEQTLTYPDNAQVDYAPNALGEPGQVGSYATGIRYEPNGAVERFTYGNGILHTRTPTLRGLTEVATDVGVLEDKYDWDENGNVAGITDQRPSPSQSRTRIMVYDARDRLTSVHYTAFNGSVDYEYDVLDNLRRTTTPYRDHRYVYDTTNRLQRFETFAGQPIIQYGYDDRGNVTHRNQHAFDVDLAGRVTRVRDAATSATLGQYRTDGNGHRVGINTGTAERPQIYSLAGQLLYEQAGQTLPVGCAPADDRLFCHSFETGSSTAAATRYLHLGSRLIAKAVAGGATTYLHTDGIGSVVAESTAGGAVSHRAIHEPFGAPSNLVTVEGPGYAGHVVDGLTGLSYMQARYYDPFAARFLAIDPLAADAGGFNRYWYANNNPYTFIDPDGRCAAMTSKHEDKCQYYAKEKMRTQNPSDLLIEAGVNTVKNILNDLVSIANAFMNDEPPPMGPMIRTASIPLAGALGRGVPRVSTMPAAVEGTAAGAGARLLDDLSRAASAADRNGLTAAGRALQKHGGRAGSAFPQVSGHGNLNRVGQSVVDDILMTPGANHVSNRFGGIDVMAPDGRGVRYDSNGNLMGFLEP